MTRPFTIVVSTDSGFRSWCRGALLRAGYRVAAPTTTEATEYFVASAYPPDVVVFSAKERLREILAPSLGHAPRAPGIAVVQGDPDETPAGSSRVEEAVERALERIASRSLEWRDDLALGVERMDAAHREQQSLLGAFESAALAGRREEAVDGLQQLRTYTERHFLDEQAAMQLHGFHEREEHAREHARLLDEIGLLSARYARDARLAVPRLVVSLRDWLEGHVMTLDRALAHHLAREPVSSDGGAHGGSP